ncbi:MAG: glycoside hydrolase family 99-like domain-containing protein, partial [Acidimicrobiales bacterium]
TVHSPLVGAYYSDWFPSNAAQGTLRQHLVPSQGPDPSRVDSADPAVAQEAIAQATRSGVDFFALDWWPTRPAQNVNVNAFLRAKNIGDIKFCMLYETWDLGFDAGNESTPVTPQLEARFDADLVTFAHRYFANPSYLRIRGRPVVVLYLTRTLTGDVQGMMTGARAVLEAQGYDPFFIGDEVFWRVTAENTAAGAPGFTEAPQVSRIDLFDAVTAYSLYAGGPPDPLTPAPDFTTFPGLTSLVADQLALYRRYQQASHGWVPVVPDVTPGFNSRGVRLSVNEHAEPRQWVPGASPGSTLAHYLSQIARPLLSPTLPMVFVTSWNEWNEDTAVAPVGGTPTASDDSPSGTAYTQGYTYGGEGWSDLDAIRDFSDMAWGRVTFAGRARAHVTVTAAVGSRIVETVHTDAEGFYVLPRTATCPPTLVLSAGGRRVTLRCRATVATRADLTDADAVEPGTRADPWQARRT